MLSDILMLAVLWLFVGVVAGYVITAHSTGVTTYGDLLMAALCGPITIILLLVSLANTLFSTNTYWRMLREFLETPVR